MPHARGVLEEPFFEVAVPCRACRICSRKSFSALLAVGALSGAQLFLRPLFGRSRGRDRDQSIPVSIASGRTYEAGVLSDFLNTSSGRMPRMMFETAHHGLHKDGLEGLFKDVVAVGSQGFDLAGESLESSEPVVGAVLANLLKLGVARESLYIQTKVHPKRALDLNPRVNIRKKVELSIANSLASLGLTYIDSLVLHSPCPSHEQTMEAWRAMEDAFRDGLVRQLGIWNIVATSDLRRMYGEAEVKPSIVQQLLYAEMGYQYERDMHAWCAETGVYLQSIWSLMLYADRRAIGGKTMGCLAEKYGVNAQMLFFRFVMGMGVVPLISLNARNQEYVRSLSIPLSAEDATDIEYLLKRNGGEGEDAEPILLEPGSAESIGQGVGMC